MLLALLLVISFFVFLAFSSGKIYGAVSERNKYLVVQDGLFDKPWACCPPALCKINRAKFLLRLRNYS